MSAHNYFSIPEKNFGKLLNCLPNLNQQKFVYKSPQELPPLSGNTSKFLNRNINYQYDLQSQQFDSEDRAGTPFSDFFSESETDTLDFHSEESDSSAGSALCRSTAEATKALAQEWERIERTLYNEDGEKCTRPHIIEECKQWRQLHPQLRVVGKSLNLPAKRLSCKQVEHDEVIAMQYYDYEQFSDNEERLSQSSNDVTPQNSPRVSIEDLLEPKQLREKISFYPSNTEDIDLSNSFCSLLQITPIQMHSPLLKKRQNHSILRSEVTSSKWMRGYRPDSAFHCDRNSAKSYVSLDTRNYNAVSASDHNPIVNNRVVTAKYRDFKRLEPLCSPDLAQNNTSKLLNRSSQCSVRKVSLPPLMLEEKKKVVTANSAKKQSIKLRKNSKCFFQLDKMRHN